MFIDIAIITAIVLALYLKTWNYKYLIDDPVKRDGYLYEGAKKVHPEFYERRRPILATVTNISVFLANCYFVYLLWGFEAAVLFAVCPLNVFSGAWITGNYYASTVLLILASHYFLGLGNIFGALAGMCFYGAALNSTINALSYVFIAPFFGMWGFTLTIPFLFFMFGKRFKCGIELRKKLHDNLNVHHSFKWSNLQHVPLCLAYYLYSSLFLNKLGFFSDFSKSEKHHKPAFFFASIAVCIAWFCLGWVVDKQMILWWFLSLGIFCHIQGHMGQYVTERYTALSNIALCVITAKMVPHDTFLIIASLNFLLSSQYVTAYKCNLDLFSHGIVNNPVAAENYNNLAQWHLERKNYHMAIQPLVMAERLTKGYKYPIYVNLAKCLLEGKRFQQALHYVKQAIVVCPNSDKESLQREAQEIEDKIKKSSKFLKQWCEL